MDVTEFTFTEIENREKLINGEAETFCPFCLINY